jgi:hypothetical protein
VATPAQNPWQQLPGESIKAFRAFVVFRDLEPKERSLQRVVSECNRSISLIGRWSSKWGWVERAQAWDNFQELKRLEKRIEEKQKMDEQHLKIVRAMRSKIIDALTKMDSEDLAKNIRVMRSWINDFIRLERLIMGEPESIEERREKIEIHASIEEQIREYAPVFQELIDEGVITLDGQPRAAVGPASEADEDGTEDEGTPVFLE